MDSVLKLVIQESLFLRDYGFSAPEISQADNNMYASLCYKYDDYFGIDVGYENCRFEINVYLVKLQDGKFPSWFMANDGTSLLMGIRMFLRCCDWKLFPLTRKVKKKPYSLTYGEIAVKVRAEIKLLKDNIALVLEKRNIFTMLKDGEPSLNYLDWGKYWSGVLSIGTEKKPFYKSIPQFMIKLPCGKTLKSTQFTVAEIKKLPTLQIDKVETYLYEDAPEWLRDAEEYVLHYGRYPNDVFINFCFQNSDLLIFSYKSDPCADAKKINMQIGTIDGEKLYSIPLRNWQIKELFGSPPPMPIMTYNTPAAIKNAGFWEKILKRCKSVFKKE